MLYEVITISGSLALLALDHLAFQRVARRRPVEHRPAARLQAASGDGLLPDAPA